METERMALSQRERDRLRVLQDVEQGHLTQVEAAGRIDLCDRQVRRQVLPAYGLQDLPIKNQNPYRGSRPNTARLPVTLGENLGGGHFYLAKNRTFLLCVDSLLCQNL